MIKGKSILVILISSLVISLALVFTLVGYYAHIEMRKKIAQKEYREILGKLQAKLYSNYIQVSDLSARIEPSSAAKEKPIIEGWIKNTGTRDLSNLILKVKFIDATGVNIYEAVFNSLEPSHGTKDYLARLVTSYFSGEHKIYLPKNSTKLFKHILTNCPKEVYEALKKRRISAGLNQWPGKLTCEILSINFTS